MADLSSVSFKFSQDGNTCGTTEECEELIVEIESSLFINKEEGAFIVLKTNTGWSIDSPEELTELLNRCMDTAIKSSGEM